MNNRILCSTGTYIGRENRFDHTLIPYYARQIDAPAFELMMLRAWYSDVDGVARHLAQSGVRFEVMHSDKDIGILLSDGNTEEALRLYELSCRIGAAIGAEKLVLHLWGGRQSDGNIDQNISAIEEMLKIAARYNILLTIENIPCTFHDPISHWKKIAARYPEAKFIFDTRFAAFHRQFDEIFESGWLQNGNIVHMHVSDFVGPPMDFTKLRPIPLPGDGIIDFSTVFPRLKPLYHGTVTLESPVLAQDGTVDIALLNQTLGEIKGNLT